MGRRVEALDVRARNQAAEQPLPPERDHRSSDGCPRCVQLARDRAQEEATVRSPAVGQRRELDRVGDLETHLPPAAGTLDVLEHRPTFEARKGDLDACLAEERQLARPRSIHVRADERPHAEAQSRERERPIRHRAAEPPAAGIAGRDVARGRPDDEHLGPRA